MSNVAKEAQLREELNHAMTELASNTVHAATMFEQTLTRQTGPWVKLERKTLESLIVGLRGYATIIEKVVILDEARNQGKL